MNKITVSWNNKLIRILSLVPLLFLGCTNSSRSTVRGYPKPNPNVVLLSTYSYPGGEVQIKFGEIIVSGERFHFSGYRCSLSVDPTIETIMDRDFDQVEKKRLNAKPFIKIKQKWAYGIIPWGQELYFDGIRIDTGGVKIHELWEAYFFQDGVLAMGRTSIKHDWAEPSDVVFIDLAKRKAIFDTWSYKSPSQISFWDPGKLLERMENSNTPPRAIK